MSLPPHHPSPDRSPGVDATGPGTRLHRERFLLALLLVQLAIVGAMFPYYAFARQDAWGLKAFAVALAALGLAAVVGVWRRAPWALWAVVVLVSLKIVVDVFNFATDLDRRLLPVAALINVATLCLALALARPIGDRVTRGMRAFFACVLALAAWVAVRGLFFPAHLAATIPFNVPPLHSRFLGAMYVSGATFMLLAIRARAWSEVRIVVTMVAIWTGMLGLVSLRFLGAFDWAEPQTWTWFIAYSAFPIVAAWIAWRQRGVTTPAAPGAAPHEPLPAPLRAYLRAQAAVLTVLAVALLAAPGAVAALWPWKISTELAQVYSAPFLSFGLGSWMAARAYAMREVRIALTATLVFTTTVLAASALHRGLFAPTAPATWLWFGGFGLASAVLLRYVLARPRRTEQP
ncbi:MAG: hypothetical protein IT332_04045 [Ardenticatenales bacterium]|nr:hypothetical protein [Ardenticatenales bacterium]